MATAKFKSVITSGFVFLVRVLIVLSLCPDSTGAFFGYHYLSKPFAPIPQTLFNAFFVYAYAPLSQVVFVQICLNTSFLIVHRVDEDADGGNDDGDGDDDGDDDNDDDGEVGNCDDTYCVSYIIREHHHNHHHRK